MQVDEARDILRQTQKGLKDAPPRVLDENIRLALLDACDRLNNWTAGASNARNIRVNARSTVDGLESDTPALEPLSDDDIREALEGKIDAGVEDNQPAPKKAVAKKSTKKSDDGDKDN